MVKEGVGILVDLSKEAALYVSFVFVRIGPKGVIGAGILLTDQKADQVIELPVGYALNIDKQCNVLPSDGRDLLQVDLSRSDG